MALDQSPRNTEILLPLPQGQSRNDGTSLLLTKPAQYCSTCLLCEAQLKKAAFWLEKGREKDTKQQGRPGIPCPTNSLESGGRPARLAGLAQKARLQSEEGLSTVIPPSRRRCRATYSRLAFRWAVSSSLWGSLQKQRAKVQKMAAVEESSPHTAQCLYLHFPERTLPASSC